MTNKHNNRSRTHRITSPTDKAQRAHFNRRLLQIGVVLGALSASCSGVWAGPHPSVKNWTPYTPVGQGVDAQNKIVFNGRMTSPQNQTENPYVPSRVITAVSGTTPETTKIIGCTVEAVTDNDKWTQDLNGDDDTLDASESGIVADSVTYKWTGGTFKIGTNADGSLITATEVGGPSAEWIVPTTPGSQTISCEINDTPTPIGKDETGTRDDTAVARSVTVIAYKLIIKRDGTEIIDPQNVQVGRIVNLSAEVQPPNLTLTNIQWSLPGTVIRDWIHSPTGSTLIPIGSNQLSSPNIKFCWVDGGNDRKVSVTGTVEGAAISSVPATFNVDRPGYGLTITPRGVVELGFTSVGSPVLRYGNAKVLEGVLFTITDAPADHGCQFYHLATNINRQMRFPSRIKTYQPTTGLDSWDPYPISVPPYYSADSPGQELEDSATEVAINDQFSMYLMFKPPGAEGTSAVYVPLKVASWGWSGYALRQRGNDPDLWEPQDLVNATPATFAVGMSTTTHPMWYRNAGPNHGGGLR